MILRSFFGFASHITVKELEAARNNIPLEGSDTGLANPSIHLDAVLAKSRIVSSPPTTFASTPPKVKQVHLQLDPQVVWIIGIWRSPQIPSFLSFLSHRKLFLSWSRTGPLPPPFSLLPSPLPVRSQSELEIRVVCVSTTLSSSFQRAPLSPRVTILLPLWRATRLNTSGPNLAPWRIKEYLLKSATSKVSCCRKLFNWGVDRQLKAGLAFGTCKELVFLPLKGQALNLRNSKLKILNVEATFLQYRWKLH